MAEAELSRDLRRVRELARVLDSAVEIPIIRVRLGADALLGLVPGVGDAVSAAIAGYPVMIAVRHRLPRALVLRLLFNIALDAVAGAVPLLGDLFDIGFKANMRNHRLIERYAAQPGRIARESGAVLWLIVGGLGLVIVGLIAVAVWIVASGIAWLMP